MLNTPVATTALTTVTTNKQVTEYVVGGGALGGVSVITPITYTVPVTTTKPTTTVKVNQTNIGKTIDPTKLFDTHNK